MLLRGGRATLLLSLFLVQAAPGSESEASEALLTANELIASQPDEMRARLLEDKLIVMQEIRESGSLSGGLIVGLVIFETPLEVAYTSLAATHRQSEFRKEVVSIETVGQTARGPVDEHRIRILFRRYAYRLQYVLEPATHQIRWKLSPDFENDLERVSGFWELYPMDDGRTLGRFGTSIDVGPMVPAFLQDAITRDKIPDTMERTRHWVNAEHRTR